MGFLDHSTNNIIIDAVLTNYGRQRLAENNGQFRIEFFSLGDDEVDYGLIKKYGRTVGKEKIVKNTPIFEAGTRAVTSMRHRMLTLPNPTIYKMPSLALESNQVSANGNVVLNGTVFGGGSSRTLTFEQKVDNAGTAVPAGLLDSTYTVYVNDRFITLPLHSLGAPEPVSKTRAYSKTNTGANQTFDILFSAKSSQELNAAAFATYGIGGVITTPVTIIGDQTGLRLDFKIEINKE